MPTRRQFVAATAALAAGAPLSQFTASAQEASPAASPMASPSASPIPSAFSDQTHQLFQQLLDGATTGDYPGIVIYAEAAEEVVFEAAGVANVETQAPLDKNAVFQIGSNTKMMTAAVVLQLQEEGLLDIDQPAATYLPDAMSRFTGGDEITVRMLLQHTSGLYDYVEDLAAAIFTEWHQTQGTAALSQAWTPDQIVDYTATYRDGYSSFYPGTPDSWHYSNTEYILLGMLIEKLTGKSYGDNLQERIFDRLGLTQTTLVDGVWDSPVAGYYQQPFDFDTGKWNLSQGWAAGGVTSTAPELAIFLRALLHGDLYAKPETLALMQTTVPAPDLLADYGMGIVKMSDTTWGHGGQTLGFNSQAFYEEATDMLFIGWVNSAVASLEFSLLSVGGSQLT